VKKEVSLLAARQIIFSNERFCTGYFCRLCRHVTDHEPITEYCRIQSREPGEKGVVGRLFGLQIVLVGRKVHYCHMWGWGCVHVQV